MKRMHRVLSLFSRGSKNARLNQLMFRNTKTINANDNGTSGYVVKTGKNTGIAKYKKNLKKPFPAICYLSKYLKSKY